MAWKESRSKALSGDSGLCVTQEEHRCCLTAALSYPRTAETNMNTFHQALINLIESAVKESGAGQCG
jgi:hypothetical protein